MIYAGNHKIGFRFHLNTGINNEGREYGQTRNCERKLMWEVNVFKSYLDDGCYL